MRSASVERSRRSVAAALVLAIGALGVAGPPLTGAQSAGPVKVPGVDALSIEGSVTDLSEAPDGTVRVATAERPRLTTTVRLRRLGDSGWIGGRTTLDRGANFASARFLPGGGALVARSNYRGNVRGDQFVDVDLTGALVSAERWEPERGRSEGPLVGPTGAALVIVQRRSGGKYRVGYAFRPAGARTFGATVPLTARSVAGSGADFVGSTDRTTEFVFAFGPDGGAAVLALPDTERSGSAYVRRISPTGQLGPRLDLGLGRRAAAHGRIAFGPTGAATAVVATREVGARTPASGKGGVFVTTLLPGATAAPAPQRLMAADINTFDGLLAVAAGPGERVAVLASAGNGARSTTRLFASTGGAFSQVATLPTIFPRDLRLFARPSGAVTALWTAQAQDEFDDAGVYVSTWPAGGAFSAPRRVTPKQRRSHVIELQEALALSDGRIAMTYGDYSGNNGPVYATIAAP